MTDGGGAGDADVEPDPPRPPPWIETGVVVAAAVVAVPTLIGFLVDAKSLNDAIGPLGLACVIVMIIGCVVGYALVRRLRRPSPRPRARGRALLGLVAVVLVLAPAALVSVRLVEYWASPSGAGGLTVVAQASYCNDWYFPQGLADADVPDRDALTTGWVVEHGGVPTAEPGAAIYEVKIQGTSPTTVILDGLRVVELERAPAPAPGGTLLVPCGPGGELRTRYFDIDLDARAPEPVAGTGDRDEPGDGLEPAVDFPYRVSTSEVEVFQVRASSRTCLCRWELALDWTSGGETGTTTIDLDGAPFAAVGGADPAGEPLDRT